MKLFICALALASAFTATASAELKNIAVPTPSLNEGTIKNIAATETYLIAPFIIVLGNGAQATNGRCSVVLGDGVRLFLNADGSSTHHVLIDGNKPPQKLTTGLTPALVQRINAQIASMGYAETLDKDYPGFVAAWNRECAK